MDIFKCYKGRFIDTEIHTDTEIIEVRPYASKKSQQINRYGYWLVMSNERLPWPVIRDFIECDFVEEET